MSRTHQNAQTDPIAHQVGYRAIQVCFALMPILFVPGIETPDLVPRLLLLQIVTLIATGAWLLSGGLSRSSPFHLPVAIYFLALSVSALGAITPFRSVHFLAKHATLFVFFLVAINTLQRRHLPGILTITATMGGLVAFWGILEYHQIIPHWIPSTGRPSSTFMFRNLAAHYLITNLPLSGLLFFIARNSRDRWIGSVCSALMFVFLLYTRTRGAWLGLFCATVLSLGIWAVWSWPTLSKALKSVFHRQVLVFAAGSLLIVAILGPLDAGFKEQHVQRFDEKKADISSALTSIFQKGGDRGRIQMWKRTLEMVSNHPWLGVGLGNWEFVYPLYDQGEQITPTANPRRPHNDLLWIFSEIGVFGWLAYLTLLGLVIWQAIRTWRHTAHPHAHLVTLMCCISIFAMIGDGFFNFPWERIPPSVIFWFCLATISIWSSEQPLAPVSTPSNKWVSRLAVPILVCALILTAKNIAFDYYFIQTLRASLLKKPKKASNAAFQALAIGPFNHQLFTLLARSLKDQKRFSEAEKYLNQSLNYHPNFANTYNNLGHLYDDWGQSTKALAYYRKALAILPNHSQARYNMGIAFEKNGQLDSAEVAYREAHGKGSYSNSAHNLAGVYKKKGLIDSAKALYLRSLNSPAPKTESLFNLGNIFTQEHDFANAIKAYEAFLQQWTGDDTYRIEAKKYLSEAYSGLGVQTEQKGDLNQALAHYQTAISQWPENAMNWYNLANVLRLQGETDQAIDAYKKSIARDSLLTNAYNNLGLTYTGLKQYPQAIETFDNALKVHPNRFDILLNMANAYLAKGDVLRAKETYKQSLKNWEGDQATAAKIQQIINELTTALSN